MKTAATGDTVKTITTHYIDGSFVESHGREVMDVIKPTNGQVIARVTLGDEEDTRRAIAAAKHAFATFGRTTKEERAKILRRLHETASARIDVRLTKDNEVWFLEANANPFLSYGHDSAESAHKAGLRYDAFIQRIVDEAMSRPA